MNRIRLTWLNSGEQVFGNWFPDTPENRKLLEAWKHTDNEKYPDILHDIEYANEENNHEDN